MATILDKTRRLKKELRLVDVYALSLGATLSSGFFLLPGIAFREAGPAVVLSYLIAVVPLLPGIMSKIELSTAMPRAGGVYYFLDRSIGPAFGTIGGLGTWLALVLKVAFALVGLGAYLTLLWPNAPVTVLAVVLAVAFGGLNVLGSRGTGHFQVLLVGSLLLLLGWFIIAGLPEIDTSRFDGFFAKGGDSILATAGLVCISYIGVSKVASVSEEVKNPERNLPLGMFLSIATALLVYALGTSVMVGVLTPEQLGGDPDYPASLTPVAKTAEVLVGRGGLIVMTIAAILAFFSVANAGILGASRYPLAMSRDQLVPPVFQNLGRFGTPTSGIAVTVACVIVCVVIFNPLEVAKLAGSFQLLLFALNCFAVVVMREAQLDSYDPGYRSPFYPWLHIVGIVAPFIIIGKMGWMPIVFCGGLFAVGSGWFMFYGRSRVNRRGAINNIFRRLGTEHFKDLDREMRGILKEKGLRAGDPFDESILEADVFDAGPDADFEAVVRRACRLLAERLPLPADTLAKGFLEGTRTGATPVTGGVALPHMRVPGITAPVLVLVRSPRGMTIDVGDLFGDSHTDETFAVFFLVSPNEDPAQHLRLLAQLASSVETEGFLARWLDAEDDVRLKEILLRDENHFTLTALPGGPAGVLDKTIDGLGLPKGSVVAVIRRDTETVVPRGDTIIRAGDRLTIIGDEAAISTVRDTYG